MNDIKWQAPPPNGRNGQHGGGKYADVAKTLRSKPGEWALINTAIPASTATYLRRRHMSKGFEVVTRQTEGAPRGRVDICARFVGEVSA